MNTSDNNNLPAIFGIIAAFALLVVGGVIISFFTPEVLPVQASAEAVPVDELFKIMLAIGGAIYLLVQGAIIYSVIRFRAQPGDDSDGPTMHGNPTLEFVWTVIPAVIVVILSVLSFQTWVTITSAKDNEVEVRATGSRFNWSFSYDVDGQDFSVNSRELHTWVGQPVKMVMSTTDVNHAFFVPAMRIKQDLLAGRTTEIRFTPTLAGEYPVLCAELCGSGHGDMRATIFVHETEEDYLAWFEPEVDVLLNPPEDPAERGLQVLSSGLYPCAGCHTLDALGWVGVTGPNLNGVGDRASRREAGLTAEEYLFRSLYFPGESLVPGFGALMPQFQVDDAENTGTYMALDTSKAIIAYLCTQTETGESACDLDNLDKLTPDN